jgi:prevent-host-death family protein
MKTVRIAELKAKLSAYLRQARGGRAVTILDRQTPIARLVPIDRGPARLVIRRPAPGASRTGDLTFAKVCPIDTDIVDLLLATRQPNR